MKATFAVILVIAAALAPHAATSFADETPEQIAVRVLRDALSGSDDHMRVLSAELAVDLRSPELVAAARDLAASPDRVVRSYALEFLTRNDLQGSREIFLTCLDVPYRSVRLRALRALLQLGEPALVPRLAQVLESDPDPDIRAVAARGLGALGGEDAGPALRQALDDAHPAVQEAAVDGLVALGELGVGLDLLDRVRKAPLWDAGRLLRLVGRVPDRTLLPRLGKLAQSGDPTIRVTAAAALLEVAGRVR